VRGWRPAALERASNLPVRSSMGDETKANVAGR
jgi:hypothetical protein